MISNKRVIAIIPARGGSKGLPGKNIRPLCGKPLIAWSIERARQSAALFGGLGLDVTLVEDDVGHKVGVEGTRALKTWLFGVLGEALPP